VVKLKLQYWDERNKEWREDWATTSGSAQADRLPGKIRITLTVHDERGVEVPFQTQVKVAMSEPLNNAPQNLVPSGPNMPLQTGASQTGPNNGPLPPGSGARVPN
jgi:hypothetical protein